MLQVQQLQQQQLTATLLITFTTKLRLVTDALITASVMVTTCSPSGFCQGVARPSTTTTTTTTTTGQVSTPGPTTPMPVPNDPASIWYAATKGTF